MGSRIYTFCAVMIAVIFWMIESLIHLYTFGDERIEVIPSDFNELWMRTLIILLIIGIGIYIDYSTNKRITRLNDRKEIYKDSANEARKILREFLYDIEYFESEAERIGGFDGNTMQHLEDALKKTKARLDSLDEVADITANNKINA